MDNIDYTKFKLGVIDSPIDEMDYQIAKMVQVPAAYPKSFDLDITDLIADNQDIYNMCVSEAICYGLFVCEHKKSGNKKPFSKGWLYGDRSNPNDKAPGLIPRAALSIATKDGVPLEEDFPLREEAPKIVQDVLQVKESLLNKAQKYKLEAYARAYTEDDIKLSLINGHPIFIVIPAYTSFFQTKGNGILAMPNSTTEHYYGNHGMFIYGWDENNNWEGFNSYGKEWGVSGGQFLMPFNYPSVEIWSMIYDTTNVVIPPKVTTYYKVQVGAFSVRDNAEKLSTEINKSRIATCLAIVNNLFKVQCGCFVSKDNATNMLNKLISLGYKDAFITTIQK